MYKVWTIFKGPDGGDAYLGHDAFLARIEWCQATCPGQYGSYMGYFEFDTKVLADAFRDAFGESKPSYLTGE